MKRTHFAAAIAMAALMSLTPGFAQKQSAPPPAPYPAAPDVQTFDKKSAELRTLMQKMQDQMARMAQTSDVAERRKLMQEHWEAMQSAMTGMRDLRGPAMMGTGHMMGPGMLGPGMMGWGDMHGYYANLSSEQLQQRRYMVDRYMGMQQIMMDHLMQHRYWMLQLPPAPASSK
jgi:hypothetical protein